MLPVACASSAAVCPRAPAGPSTGGTGVPLVLGRRIAPPSMNFFSDFMAELDAFADDAVGRRMGNGAKFYGKRKSSFYGADDTQKKADPKSSSREEDYSGPEGGSYFVLGEKDEQGRPLEFLTRQEARARKAQSEAAAEEEEDEEALMEEFRRLLSDGGRVD
mmetsp:Transcript_49416/g.163686  ORF Transcript_49416/g.163686 Transcript_49416/m.163686 type:complete len:162 (-) Transcript_49416:77-562(-)|eukprot:CAMPEP_0196688696 /NCGR_PEP_ID=MMETSP1090-20130531/17345_1 /TAXON_ID=37098 /ORGANISM="Isochrysis sp, Strain CCMP1244" /LENGTH=161 /DNA_ID=CAMNT_0042027649 /DNA_START=78 /DNA_END=563 /DNA_ORIENTATION=-